jgi:hypothetical protein
MRRVIITDHALKRWRERVGSKKTKNQLAHIVYGSILSRSRLGIKQIDDSLKFQLPIPTYEVYASIILQGQPARWKVLTFYEKRKSKGAELF